MDKSDDMINIQAEQVYKQFGGMDQQERERLRMLQNRMRNRQSRPGPTHQESLKTIKSTDSKRFAPVIVRLEDLNEREQSVPAADIRLSEQQIRCNRKITDYFPVKKPPVSPLKKHTSQAPFKLQPVPQPAAAISQTRSPGSPDQKSNRISEEREEARVMREAMREKEQLNAKYRSQIVECIIREHRRQREELKQKIYANKVRLGEYMPDSKGKEHWVDGSEIRRLKEKIESLVKEKQSLERSKRQARRGKEGEETEEWRVSLASQSYFLGREEAQCQESLKKLEEEKSLHIKQYRLVYEQQRSRYGRAEAESNSWPKIKKYQLLGLLGKGGFSEVYKGVDTELLLEVAIKVHQFHANWNASAKDNYIKHALRQNHVQKMLSHPNIVQLHDTVQVDSSSFCTVLEYCEGPDLSYYLKKHRKIPEKEAKLIIRQVINAIKYLHELPDKVIHYDLKPQNILFHKGRIKITDFGLCKTTKEDRIELTSQGVGTYWYLPPECFTPNAVITPKVDVWSIGVIFFEMLYGEKPYGHQMSQVRILNEGIMLKATQVKFPPTQKGLVSKQSQQFIKECLKYNTAQRLDIRGVAGHRLFEKK